MTEPKPVVLDLGADAFCDPETGVCAVPPPRSSENGEPDEDETRTEQPDQ